MGGIAASTIWYRIRAKDAAYPRIEEQTWKTRAPAKQAYTSSSDPMLALSDTGDGVEVRVKSVPSMEARNVVIRVRVWSRCIHAATSAESSPVVVCASF
jgi:hypothetical protein